ncbi:MAG: hypothetical protein WDZ57_02885 [Demequina sp.]
MTKTPPEPIEVPENVRRHSRWMMALILLTIVGFLMGFPLMLVALVTAPAAAVFGILALIASANVPRMGPMRISVAVGLAVCATSLPIALFGVLAYDVMAELEDCQARAVTQTAERACTEAYDQGIADLMESYGVSIPE